MKLTGLLLVIALSTLCWACLYAIVWLITHI